MSVCSTPLQREGERERVELGGGVILLLFFLSFSGHSQ